jgi:diguanylate cyclase (GGDEF)-like protein
MSIINVEVRVPSEVAASGADRDRRAEDRDQRAAGHDEESRARDDRAEARDERAEAREKAADVIDPGAASDRTKASRDRRRGATDRSQAAGDREAASADRVVAAKDRAESSLDGLTRAYRREAGVVALEREIARSNRTNQPFTLAFADVDDLKGTNDSSGHAAGDQLLVAAVAAIRGRLRSYDLIVRYGGDEFLCGLLDVTLEDARGRFAQVNEDLAAQGASLTVGIAQREGDASLQDLIALADEAMYEERAGARRRLRRFRLAPSASAGSGLPALGALPASEGAPHADR